MTHTVLVARTVFPEVMQRLAAAFEVRGNPTDEPWSEDALIARLQGCEGALVTPGEPIGARLLAACPALRAVCSLAVGVDNIDVAACTARGVVVTHAPDVLTETTADLGFALLLAAARRIGEAERYLRRGAWQRWAVDQLAGMDVHGTMLGILGLGRIGRAIARRAALGFGMRVVHHQRTRPVGDVLALEGFSSAWLPLDDLLAQADHVMVTLPLSPQTRHVVGARELALMKPRATLVNLGRGGVVDDAALAAALRQGHLGAAGLDVFEGEPRLHPDLLALDNVVLTPHIGSSTRRTRLAMAQLAADNLLAALGGAPVPTPVDRAVLDAHGRLRR